MPACTRPAVDFTPEQLRFPPAAGYTVRADFTGGEISSDLGALLLSAVDRRIGLIDRLAAAITDSRHASYIKHPLRDLLTQRVFQIAPGPAARRRPFLQPRVDGIGHCRWQC